MTAEILLSKLEKVRSTGAGRWVARCPSHADKTPSLAIRETSDGTLLLHCFSGCSAHEIVSAIGLELQDLFPNRGDQQSVKGQRRRFPASDIMRIISSECQLVYLCARTVHAGAKLSETDLARLLIAASRINAALHAGGIHVD